REIIAPGQPDSGGVLDDQGFPAHDPAEEARGRRHQSRVTRDALMSALEVMAFKLSRFVIEEEKRELVRPRQIEHAFGERGNEAVGVECRLNREAEAPKARDETEGRPTLGLHLSNRRRHDPFGWRLLPRDTGDRGRGAESVPSRTGWTKVPSERRSGITQLPFFALPIFFSSFATSATWALCWISRATFVTMRIVMERMSKFWTPPCLLE